MLAGPETLIDEAKTWRHRYGGRLFQQFPTALAALTAWRGSCPGSRSTCPRARGRRRPERGLRRGGRAVDARPPRGAAHPPVPGLAAVRPEVLKDAALRQAEETALPVPPLVPGAPGPGPCRHRGHGERAGPGVERRGRTGGGRGVRTAAAVADGLGAVRRTGVPGTRLRQAARSAAGGRVRSAGVAGANRWARAARIRPWRPARQDRLEAAVVPHPAQDRQSWVPGTGGAGAPSRAAR